MASYLAGGCNIVFYYTLSLAEVFNPRSKHFFKDPKMHIEAVMYADGGGSTPFAIVNSWGAPAIVNGGSDITNPFSHSSYNLWPQDAIDVIFNAICPCGENVMDKDLPTQYVEELRSFVFQKR